MTFLVCLVFFYRKARPILSFRWRKGALFRPYLRRGTFPFGLTYSPNITLILLNKSAVIFGGTIAVTFCYAPIRLYFLSGYAAHAGVSDGSQPRSALAYGGGSTI